MTNPLTNPFQNFNDAMRCVIERGGKAWRAKTPWRTVHKQGILLYETNVTRKKRVPRIGIYALVADDLTATDWVWEEAVDGHI